MNSHINQLNIIYIYIYILKHVSKTFSKQKNSKITFPRFETFRFRISVFASMQPRYGRPSDVKLLDRCFNLKLRFVRSNGT